MAMLNAPKLVVNHVRMTPPTNPVGLDDSRVLQRSTTTLSLSYDASLRRLMSLGCCAATTSLGCCAATTTCCSGRTALDTALLLPLAAVAAQWAAIAALAWRPALYAEIVGRERAYVDHFGAFLLLLPIPSPCPVLSFAHEVCLCVPYGSGPLSREHAGFRGGTKRPPSGSRYLLRARLCMSSLPKRSLSILRIWLRPARHVWPPRWKRPIKKFSAKRLPSAVWYGSRNSLLGTEELERATAVSPKKLLGAVENRPWFMVSTLREVERLCSYSRPCSYFGAFMSSSSLCVLDAHVQLCA